ncbi:MAG: precorrin-4 C(11)-methyltransferase [Muribaculaceae bacterium]|nr:precorrin-4 C(11)-methyltransferase [Muribaculaceae bacterium]
MQKIAIINISSESRQLASVLKTELNAQYVIRPDVGKQWKEFDAFIFIGAMGICVRTIAPYIKDKHEDPAVICVDGTGQHVISVLSGHVGGANDLTRKVAATLGVEPVITTYSDNVGLWSLDTLAQRFNWTLADKSKDMNAQIFAFTSGKPTALLMDIEDKGTDYLENTLPDHVNVIYDISDADPELYSLLIIVSPYVKEVPCGMLSLHFVPIVGTVGFGLAHHPDDYHDIYEQMNEALANAGLMPCACDYCTIDVKADEPFIRLLRDKYHKSIRFFSAEQLAAVEVPNPSDTVAKHVGTPSVCEAAAILGSNNGKLIVPKIKGKNFTLALAIDHKYLPHDMEGFIEIVGAGPGDPDLVSVRGRKMLERADLILYAGSLVPRELTLCAKAGATVRSSAGMNLEEQCALMKEFYDQGKFIVRLHTGDPCIFGAIQEQMAFFDQHNMHYHITPGISSFLAAAAELRSQFTIPERTQTIILTRGEGRTPMPEKEQLHLLARSQSTMCIFLSAAIVDDVQRELLMEYPEDTPVAACYHLTWPDQRIYRGVLKDLAKIVHDNNLTLTTMLVVGEAIDNRKGLSELYNKHFTHLFRKGE